MQVRAPLTSGLEFRRSERGLGLTRRLQATSERTQHGAHLRGGEDRRFFTQRRTAISVIGAAANAVAPVLHTMRDGISVYGLFVRFTGVLASRPTGFCVFVSPL